MQRHCVLLYKFIISIIIESCSRAQDLAVGLSWREETELRKALYASMQKQKQHREKDDQQVHGALPADSGGSCSCIVFSICYLLFLLLILVIFFLFHGYHYCFASAFVAVSVSQGDIVFSSRTWLWKAVISTFLLLLHLKSRMRKKLISSCVLTIATRFCPLHRRRSWTSCSMFKMLQHVWSQGPGNMSAICLR